MTAGGGTEDAIRGRDEPDVRSRRRRLPQARGRRIHPVRGTGWAVVVVVGGLSSAGVAVLVERHALPAAVSLVGIGVVPLVVLVTAFVGLVSTDAVAMSAVVALTAVVAPIADVWARSVAAGNLDDATLLGLGSGLAIAASGLLAAVSAMVRWHGRGRAAAV